MSIETSISFYSYAQHLQYSEHYKVFNKYLLSEFMKSPKKLMWDKNLGFLTPSVMVFTTHLLPSSCCTQLLSLNTGITCKENQRCSSNIVLATLMVIISRHSYWVKITTLSRGLV